MRILLTAIALLAAVAAQAQDTFAIDTISDALLQRMRGKSMPEGCTISPKELRHLTLLHYDLEGRVRQGELVCNRRIADDLLCIFQELYRQHYPIGSVRLIDDYDADDERSMQANNTSCFCFRTIAGSTKISKHAQGMAIDINPLFNPCVKGRRVQPASARKYADRQRRFPCKITTGDLCYRLFTERGFKWGGAWNSLKDYQHFEK